MLEPLDQREVNIVQLRKRTIKIALMKQIWGHIAMKFLKLCCPLTL